MVAKPVRLDKVKRPAGIFEFDAQLIDEDAAGIWLSYLVGSPWRAPHDTGTMPCDAILLLRLDRPFVTWWVDQPPRRRLEIDVCLPPTETPDGFSFIDLELDPVRHESTGMIEIEDDDEFQVALQEGWMTADEGELAAATAARMKGILAERVEPWGEEGWHRLDRVRQQRESLRPER